MATFPGTIAFGELSSTPSVPPAGYALIYLKTDNVLYILDSSGVEVAIGSSSFISALTGDVTATGPGSSVATVVFVGGKTAAEVAQSVTDTQAATSSNTPNTIVKRDGSGNFAAGTITANLTGSASNNVLKSGDTMTGALTINVSALQALLVGSNTLVVDTVNNRVGINNATPTQALDVVGNGLFSGTITASNFTGTLTGTNTGDVTLAPVGASPNANAASLSGQILTLQPANSTNPGVLTAIAQSIGGIKTFINQLLVSDTTQSTNKDTGSIVIEGGLGVEKNINAGGNINAVGTVTGSNISGTNTGDVTVLDTNSIDLTIVGQLLSADLKLSADAADAGNLKATTTIHADGLHIEYPFAVPVQIGTSNFIGASSSFSLSDHVHAHGAQTDQTLHAVATGSLNGFMSATDKTKLDAATASNTPNTLVFRDGSGNFSAGTITANLNGNATTSTTSTNFSGSLSGDVTGTQSTTVVGKIQTHPVSATAPTDAQLLVYNTGTVQYAPVSISSDATIVNTGALTISVGAVTDTKASLAVKPAVTVAATTNQTLSGTPTIDGQATAAGSLILLTAQTTGSQNGPWVAAAGAWSRPTWYPSGGTTQAFQFITTFVRLGTVYQGSVWRQTAAAPITIDTTSTTWVVTPLSGNYKSNFQLGPVTGAAVVNLAFANANTANLSWNPTASFTLTLPPTQGAAGTFLSNDGTGILSWTNPNVNIDGGTANSVYTPAQVINGGTP